MAASRNCCHGARGSGRIIPVQAHRWGRRTRRPTSSPYDAATADSIGRRESTPHRVTAWTEDTMTYVFPAVYNQEAARLDSAFITQQRMILTISCI